MARHAKGKFRSGFSALLAPLLVAAGFVAGPIVAQASEFDVNFQPMVFNEENQTRTLIRGGSVTVYNGGESSGDAGEQLNDKVLYSRVVQVGSTWIDALVEVVDLTGTITISRFDGGSAVSNSKNLFQTDITSSNTSTISLKFDFFESGTFDPTSSEGNRVTLKNVLVNSYDIDGSQNNSRQFSQFTGFQKYRIANSPSLSVKTSADSVTPAVPAGATRFLSDVTQNTSASNASRIQVTYDYLSTFTATHGVDNAGSGGLSYFALEFGPGDAFGSSSLVSNTSANRPPTSTDTEVFFASSDVSGDVPRVLTVPDFGNYSDPDSNPFVQIRVDSLPTNGALKKHNGTSWVDVSLADLVTVADIEDGNLGYFYVGPTGPDDFTFSVNDNLAFSSSSYTLTLTPVTGTQTITFPQPSDQPFGQTLASSATASSSLPVVLQSNSLGICSVSGLNIITRSTAGVCSITATQSGDSSFAAADPVTRTFNVSATVTTYTLTLDGNGNDSGTVPGDLTSSGGSVSIPGNTGTLIKNGFTFGGWTIGGTDYTDGDPYTLNSNVTATAIWTAVVVQTPASPGPRFELSFGAPTAESGLAPGSLQGRQVVIPGNTGGLVRPGFTFAGWIIGGIEYPTGTTLTLTTNVIAYAYWIPNTLRLVDPDTDEEVAETLDQVDTVILPDDEAVNRDGFTLSGWQIGTEVYEPGAQVAVVGPMVAFAIWQPLPAVDSNVPSVLADTGTEVSLWLAFASMLLAAGSALLVYARRRA